MNKDELRETGLAMIAMADEKKVQYRGRGGDWIDAEVTSYGIDLPKILVPLS